jgi:hypothetical protein
MNWLLVVYTRRITVVHHTLRSREQAERLARKMHPSVVTHTEIYAPRAAA